MTTTPNRPRAAGPAGLLAAAVLIALYLLLRFVPAAEAPTPAIHVIRGLLPATAVAWFALVQLQTIRRLDEMHRRIQLEALAFGYPFAFVLILAVRFLQAEGLLGGVTLANLWPVIPFPYFVGLLLAWRRYR